MNLEELKQQSLSDDNFISQLVFKIKQPDNRSEFFRIISGIGQHWQKNPTPLSLVRRIVEKTTLENKNILVLFNLEFLQVLIEEKNINPKNIIYVADNKLEYLSASKIFKVQSYQLSDYTFSAMKNLITGIDMKFDLVFSNPPYNGNIDIKILNEVIDFAEEMIIVHPAMWLVENKNTLSDFVKFKNKTVNRIKSAEIFNGNPVFDIKLEKPTGIIHFAHSNTIEIHNHFTNEIYEVKDHTQVSIHGKKWLEMLPLVEKIKDYCLQNSSIWNNIVKSVDDISDDKFYCQTKMKMSAWCVPQINSYKSRMFTFIDDDYKIINKATQRDTNRIPNNPTFEFNTELERENFANYCKTDFARFCLSIYKINENLVWGEMSMIPWLDFTEEWDDEKLFDKFDVSQELQDYIKDFLPDFHGIRK